MTRGYSSYDFFETIIFMVRSFAQGQGPYHRWKQGSARTVVVGCFGYTSKQLWIDGEFRISDCGSSNVVDDYLHF